MNAPCTLPGFGDEATWPAIGNNGDPRNEDALVDEVEQAQDLMVEIREQIDRAETAVFRRDWKTYRLAMRYVHDLAGSLFQ